MYPQVIEEFKLGARLSGDKSIADFAAALEQGFRLAGWKGALSNAIEVSKRQRKTGYFSPYVIARMYCDLGDKVHAFEWLDIAYQEHDNRLIGMKTDFVFDPLRSDPRYAELVRKVGLSQ